MSRSGDEWRNPGEGSTLVFVPAGTFTMGCGKRDLEKTLLRLGAPADALRLFYDETPVAEVHLDEYWIGKYAVTNGQFMRFYEETGRLRNPDLSTPDRYNFETLLAEKACWPYPISMITWFEAVEYCRWGGMDLPTEAEWEKAARGTDQRMFPWGNEARAELANTAETSMPMPDGIEVTQLEEGRSPYGCVQMAGNVSEWCRDWYGPESYASMPRVNPRGPDEGTSRVCRGGCTEKVLAFARTTAREFAPPNFRGDWIGFRPVIRRAESD
jgi:formylglycine-generating enzyme required for sulfatase activity